MVIYLHKNSGKVLCGAVVISTVSAFNVNALGGSESQKIIKDKIQSGFLSSYKGELLALLGIAALFAILYCLFSDDSTKDFATEGDFNNLFCSLQKLKNDEAVKGNKSVENLVVSEVKKAERFIVYKNVTYAYDKNKGAVLGCADNSSLRLTKEDLKSLEEKIRRDLSGVSSATKR